MNPNILIVLRKFIFFFDINNIPPHDIKSMIPPRIITLGPITT